MFGVIRFRTFFFTIFMHTLPSDSPLVDRTHWNGDNPQEWQWLKIASDEDIKQAFLAFLTHVIQRSAKELSGSIGSFKQARCHCRFMATLANRSNIVDDGRFKMLSRQARKVLKQVTGHQVQKAVGVEDSTHAAMVSGMAKHAEKKTPLEQAKTLVYIVFMTLTRWFCQRAASVLAMHLGEIDLVEDQHSVLGAIFLWNMHKHKTDVSGEKGPITFPLFQDARNIFSDPALALSVLLLLYEDYYFLMMGNTSLADTSTTILLFPSFDQSNNPRWTSGVAANAQTFSHAIRRSAEMLHLLYRITGHSGRHYISYLAAKVGLNLFQMMTWGGWRSLSEMAGYVHRSKQMMMDIGRQAIGQQPVVQQVDFAPYKLLPNESIAPSLGPNYGTSLPAFFKAARYHYQAATGKEFPDKGTPMPIRCRLLLEIFMTLPEPRPVVFVPNVQRLNASDHTAKEVAKLGAAAVSGAVASAALVSQLGFGGFAGGSGLAFAAAGGAILAGGVQAGVTLQACVNVFATAGARAIAELTPTRLAVFNAASRRLSGVFGLGGAGANAGGAGGEDEVAGAATADGRVENRSATLYAYPLARTPSGGRMDNHERVLRWLQSFDFNGVRYPAFRLFRSHYHFYISSKETTAGNANEQHFCRYRAIWSRLGPFVLDELDALSASASSAASSSSSSPASYVSQGADNVNWAAVPKSALEPAVKSALETLYRECSTPSWDKLYSRCSSRQGRRAESGEAGAQIAGDETAAAGGEAAAVDRGVAEAPAEAEDTIAGVATEHDAGAAAASAAPMRERARARSEQPSSSPEGARGAAGRKGEAVAAKRRRAPSASAPEKRAAGATSGDAGAGAGGRMEEEDAAAAAPGAAPGAAPDAAAGAAAGARGAAASGAAASGARGHTKGGGARLLPQGQRLQAAIPGYHAAQAAQAAAAAAADAQAEEAAAGYPPRGATALGPTLAARRR